MKKYLHLMERIRLGPKRPADSYGQSTFSYQLTAKCQIFKTNYLAPFLLFILVFVSCAALAQEPVVHTAPAAQAESEITPLKIGDKIPDELWKMYFPVVSANSEQVQYLSLGDFKDKLIILDFWATWCAPCITSLHKLDTLQKQFKDDLMVIPTSYEPENKVKPFLTNRKVDLPSLIEEKELKKYFPHRSIPHQVWIRNGKVIAIPETAYANTEVINSIIENTEVEFLQKDIDTKELTLNNLFLSNLTLRKVGNTDGRIFTKNGISINNISIQYLFAEAYVKEITYEGRINRILLEVNESLKSIINPPEVIITGNYAQDTDAMNRLNKSTYCYQLSLPENKNKSDILNFMQQDLNRIFKLYLGVEARIEEREVLCLVLTGIEEKIKSSGNDLFVKSSSDGFILKNMPIDELVRSIAYQNFMLSTPIINGTNFKGGIDINLKSNFTDISALSRELQSFGLELKEEVRSIPMLVIRNES